jgi:hypothetical protein
MRKTLVLTLLAGALPLIGAPAIVESFDMPANPPATVGSDGAYAGTESKGWLSTWVPKQGSAMYRKLDLSFPELESSGGSIRLANNSTMVRQIDESYTGTVYGSYRVRMPKIGKNAIVALHFGLPNVEDMTSKTSLASIMVKGWASPLGGLSCQGKIIPAKTGEGISPGEDVLVLYKIKGLPKPGKKSDLVFNMWILNADQVAHFAANGFNEKALLKAKTGMGADRVLQNEKISVRGAKATLVKGLVVAAMVKWAGNVTFDEIRLSTESLAEAAGLKAS